ncbi:MAG: hypothetical protein JRH10_11570 [Deltaproteobacteria bacterium]|nr:hypothetical protein [Deltaproteobacteria bacterium]MBW2447930.1 hypothetical protein [Deltaproteobacteria bacterium]
MGASVKGIFLAGAVASVRKAIREGRVAREQVELRLDGYDVPFLDEKVDVGIWYPIATLGHFLDVLADLQDGEHDLALANIGRAAADMAAQTGRYAQLDTSRKAGDSPTEVLRYGRLVTSVITAFYDFSRMSFGPDPNDAAAFQIDWFDVGDLPESNRFAAEGFIERIAYHASDGELRVSSRRPTPDHIVITIRFA